MTTTTGVHTYTHKHTYTYTHIHMMGQLEASGTSRGGRVRAVEERARRPLMCGWDVSRGLLWPSLLTNRADCRCICRNTGDTVELARMQVFAIEAQEQKIDIHPEANPTAVRLPHGPKTLQLMDACLCRRCSWRCFNATLLERCGVQAQVLVFVCGRIVQTRCATFLCVGNRRSWPRSGSSRSRTKRRRTRRRRSWRCMAPRSSRSPSTHDCGSDRPKHT